MDAIGLALAVLVGVGSYAVTSPAFRATTKPAPVASLERPRPIPKIAPLGQQAHDIRSFDAWITHPGFAITPAAVMAVFRQAEAGYPQQQCDLFDDIVEGDSHLRNLLEQREQAV